MALVLRERPAELGSWDYIELPARLDWRNRTGNSMRSRKHFTRERRAMRLKLPIAILATYLVTTLPVEAAFVIKLKNGNEFITSRYWQDSKQVLFETYDGTFGVDKAFVTKVEKSDKPVRLITTAQAAAEVKPAEITDKAVDERNKSLTESQEKLPPKKNEDDPIFKHFLSIRERSKNIGGMLSSELNLLAKDLGDLKRAMQLGGKTNEFLDEFRELHDIAERVEDAIIGRR